MIYEIRPLAVSNGCPICNSIPAASSWRTLPSQPRVSARSRASACGLRYFSSPKRGREVASNRRKSRTESTIILGGCGSHGELDRLQKIASTRSVRSLSASKSIPLGMINVKSQSSPGAINARGARPIAASAMLRIEWSLAAAKTRGQHLTSVTCMSAFVTCMSALSVLAIRT